MKPIAARGPMTPAPMRSLRYLVRLGLVLTSLGSMTSPPIGFWFGGALVTPDPPALSESSTIPPSSGAHRNQLATALRPAVRRLWPQSEAAEPPPAAVHRRRNASRSLSA